MTNAHARIATVLLALLLALLPVGYAATEAHAAAPQAYAGAEGHWYKGQLHCHSHWSDGDQYPEMVYDWYKSHGYHFVGLSDHNILSKPEGLPNGEKEKWVDVDKSRGKRKAYDDCVKRFGKDHMVERTSNGRLEVRLKTFAELKKLFEEPGRFCVIQAEEITGSNGGHPVHSNAINLEHLIMPHRDGKNIPDTIRHDFEALYVQRKAVGRPMLVFLNHTNWRWCIPAEEFADLDVVRYFELYNGGPDCRNFGDKYHASTERVWDIVNAIRLAKGTLPVLYGVATDDTHTYTNDDPKNAVPGRAWVTVRSKELTPNAITQAMLDGNFYASTGVELDDVRYDGETLSVKVRPEAGAKYTIQFIGTCKGCDVKGEPIETTDGKVLRATHRYSKDIGRVLAEAKGTAAAYAMKGNELYVRAKVVSTKKPRHPHKDDQTAVAWTQPVTPR